MWPRGFVALQMMVRRSGGPGGWGGGGSVVGGDGYSVKADLAEVVARSWWGIPGLVWVKLFE